MIVVIITEIYVMLTQIVYHREMVHIDVYVEKVILVSISMIISPHHSGCLRNSLCMVPIGLHRYAMVYM